MSKNYAEYTAENGRYRVDDEHDEYWVMFRENPDYEGVIDKEWVYPTYEEMVEAWDGEEYIEGDVLFEQVCCDQAHPDALDDEYPEPYQLLVTWHQNWLS